MAAFYKAASVVKANILTGSCHEFPCTKTRSKTLFHLREITLKMPFISGDQRLLHRWLDMLEPRSLKFTTVFQAVGGYTAAR